MSRLARDLLVGLALLLAGMGGVVWQASAAPEDGEESVPQLICPLH